MHNVALCDLISSALLINNVSTECAVYVDSLPIWDEEILESHR